MFSKEDAERLAGKIHGKKNEVVHSFLVAYAQDPDSVSAIFPKTHRAYKDYELFDNMMRERLITPFGLKKEFLRAMRIASSGTLIDFLWMQESIAFVLKSFAECTDAHTHKLHLQLIAEIYQIAQASAAAADTLPIPRLTRASSRAAAAASDFPAAAAAPIPPLTRSVSKKIGQVLENLKEYRELIRAALISAHVVPARLTQHYNPAKAQAYQRFAEAFDRGFTIAAKQGVEPARQEAQSEKAKDEFCKVLIGIERPKPEQPAPLRRRGTGAAETSLYFQNRSTYFVPIGDLSPEEQRVASFLRHHTHILEFLDKELPRLGEFAHAFASADQAHIITFIEASEARKRPAVATPPKAKTPSPLSGGDTEPEDNNEEEFARPAPKARRSSP